MNAIRATILLSLVFFCSHALAAPVGKSSKNINFEDEVVEGINRKPLDSVNQISERDSQAHKHLYKKRAGFADRNQILMNELRLQQ